MGKSRLIGAKAHIARLKHLSDESTAREVGKALFAAGEMIQVEAQIGITSGAVSGKNHVPGPIGGYPNADTHVLANNIETVQVRTLEVEVSSNAPYSAAVHFGDSKRGGRPFMELARDAKRKQVTQMVRRGLDRAVKRSRPTGDS